MKKFLLFFTLIAISGFSDILSAQIPNWSWAMSFSSANSDQGRRVATDLSGNVFMTGQYSGTITFGTTTLTNSNGAGDVFIVKMDPSGNVLWAKSVGGNDLEDSWGVDTDASGNVFIVGSFESDTIKFGTTSLVNAYNSGTRSDIFIAKYDANGNLLWAKRAGNNYSDEAFGIATDLNGDVYVSGNFQSSTITFGTTTLTNTSAPHPDIFIAKYDASGNVIWARSASSTVSGSPADKSLGLATDAIGNVYMTGYFEGATITFGNTTLNNTYTDFGEVFLVKYDTNGDVLWAKSAGSLTDDVASSVATDESGSVVICGYYYGPTITFGATTLTNSYQSFPSTSDIFIAKYDTAGNVMWAKGASGASNENVGCVATDSQRNIFMTGSFLSPSVIFGTDTLVNAGSWSDIFIVKYDSIGNQQWAERAGGNGLDNCQSITTNTTGDAYMTGWFQSSAISFGTTTLTNLGSYDIFIARIGAPLSSNIAEQSTHSKMIIAPNPFNSETVISFDEEKRNSTLRIIDVMGKETRTIRFNGNQVVLEKGEMKAGIYFVQVYDELKRVMSRKIMIE